MQRTELLKYGKFLTSLISSAILNTAAPLPFEGMDWTKLFNLAKKHDLAVMIYPLVKNMDIPEDARILFEKDKNRMVARTTRQTIEAERVMAELEKHSIKYIKLKGSHIKDYYPSNCIRTFGDIDLCLTPEGREKAKLVMADLGYTLDSSIDYHDEYQKDKFHIFEIHSSITPEDSKYSDVFTNPFSKAVATNEDKLCYVFNNEYLYLHLLIHLHKHFTVTGCGIRLFVDFLVFNQKIKDIDFDYVESILKQYGMLDFYSTVKQLIDFFFFDKKATDDLLRISEYIFENQAVGVYKHHVASLGFFGKAKYFLKIWFPPAKELAFRYPVLNKVPVLLPVCWLRRIFYSLFFNRAAFTTQANNIKKANSEKYKNIKNVRQLAEKSR